MKSLIISLLLRLLSRPIYNRMKKDEIRDLIDDLANDPKYVRFPDYLDQVADGYKNQYLYSQKEELKGMVAAFTLLRELLMSNLEKNKKRQRLERKRKAPKKGIVKY